MPHVEVLQQPLHASCTCTTTVDGWICGGWCSVGVGKNHVVKNRKQAPQCPCMRIRAHHHTEYHQQSSGQCDSQLICLTNVPMNGTHTRVHTCQHVRVNMHKFNKQAGTHIVCNCRNLLLAFMFGFLRVSHHHETRALDLVQRRNE